MDRRSLKRDLTLMLISLSSWAEGKGPSAHSVAWKGYDFDVLDDLQVDGFVSSSRKSKSLALTEEGRQHAEELFQAHDIQVDAEPPA